MLHFIFLFACFQGLKSQHFEITEEYEMLYGKENTKEVLLCNRSLENFELGDPGDRYGVYGSLWKKRGLLGPPDIYIFGGIGWNDSTFKTERIMNSLWLFNHEKRNWTFVGQNDTSTAGHADFDPSNWPPELAFGAYFRDDSSLIMYPDENGFPLLTPPKSLLVFGGVTYNKTSPNPSETMTTNELWELRLSDAQWRRVLERQDGCYSSSSPSPLCDRPRATEHVAFTLILNTSTTVFFGGSYLYDGERRYVNTLYTYTTTSSGTGIFQILHPGDDPSTCAWKLQKNGWEYNLKGNRKQLPTPREGASIFVDSYSAQPSIFIFGGCMGHRIGCFNDLWSFSLGTYEFRKVSGDNLGYGHESSTVFKHDDFHWGNWPGHRGYSAYLALEAIFIIRDGMGAYMGSEVWIYHVVNEEWLFYGMEGSNYTNDVLGPPKQNSVPSGRGMAFSDVDQYMVSGVVKHVIFTAFGKYESLTDLFDEEKGEDESMTIYNDVWTYTYDPSEVCYHGSSSPFSSNCVCDEGWTGPYCDLPLCPGSVEGGQECSGHGNCTINGCECFCTENVNPERNDHSNCYIGPSCSEFLGNNTKTSYALHTVQTEIEDEETGDISFTHEYTQKIEKLRIEYTFQAQSDAFTDNFGMCLIGSTVSEKACFGILKYRALSSCEKLFNYTKMSANDFFPPGTVCYIEYNISTGITEHILVDYISIPKKQRFEFNDVNGSRWNIIPMTEDLEGKEYMVWEDASGNTQYKETSSNNNNDTIIVENREYLMLLSVPPPVPIDPPPPIEKEEDDDGTIIVVGVSAAGGGAAIGLGTLIIVVSLVCSFCCCLLCCVVCVCACSFFGFTAYKLRMRKLERLARLLTTQDIDLIFEEKKSESSSDLSHLKINKSLFHMNYDKIRIVKMIGEGGSDSQVYKATYSGRVVAFKCFNVRKGNSVGSTQHRFEEFEREVEILGSLRHPNVLSFFGACLKPPRVGIVMEYCELGDLTRYMSRHKLDCDVPIEIQEKIRYLKDVCSAMRFLHENDVIHRDLKPDNVLVTENCEMKVMDFGLSRVVKKGSQGHLTKRLGTAFFMSPEVTKGLKYDESCDIFSFSILIWEVVYNDFLPYGRDAPTNIEFRVSSDPDFRPKIFTKEEVVEKMKKNEDDDESSEDEDYYEGGYDIDEEKMLFDEEDVSWLREIMQKSWDVDPERRPSFKEIDELILKHGKLEDTDNAIRQELGLSLRAMKRPSKSGSSSSFKDRSFKASKFTSGKSKSGKNEEEKGDDDVGFLRSEIVDIEEEIGRLEKEKREKEMLVKIREEEIMENEEKMEGGGDESQNESESDSVDEEKSSSDEE